MIAIAPAPTPYYLHLANYCDGPVTCVTVSTDPDPLGWAPWRISANLWPDSRRLIRDHFYLTTDPTQRIMIDRLIAQRIIEIVPGGLPDSQGHPPYRLCAGILPDTDARWQPLEAI